MQGKSRRYWAIGTSTVLGLVFLTSGIGKLVGRTELFVGTPVLKVLPSYLASAIERGLPWVELILGVFLLIGVCTLFMASFSYLLIACFVFYNSWMISSGLGYKPCGCFGIVEKLFQGKLSTLDSLYIDMGLFFLAGLIIYFHRSEKFFNLKPWFIKAR